MMQYDAVVLGLGGMGSAALAHLATRNKRVLGIEQFGRAHDCGSSAGRSRIIRMAYFEDPAYVPLLRRAYELWAQLENESGARLLDLCGVLMVGPAASPIIAGAVRSARTHGIVVEALDHADIARRYPVLRLLDGDRGLFEPHAGVVFPEAAIAAHLTVAERAGAELRFDTPVRDYAAHPDGITVVLADGSTVETARLAICAGPWLAGMADHVALPLRVQRNVQVWFEPNSAAYDRARFPAFFLDRPGLPAALYGFPDLGDGVKAALHGFGETTRPESLNRTVHADDIAAVKDALDGWMPGAAARYVDGKVCMYTLTPDEHFVIDTDPRDRRIVVAGGFSGHGYKFCSVVGEIVADLALTGASRHPIGFLSLDRFRKTA